MKKLKRWLAALLVWELVTLRYKDEKFKTNITNANSPLDKIKVAFDGLFTFNKEIIQEAQQANYEELKKKALARFDKERILLEDKLTSREQNVETRSKEKAPIYLMGLEDQFNKYESKALARKDRLVHEYDLEDTVKNLEHRIDKARKNLTDKKDSV